MDRFLIKKHTNENISSDDPIPSTSKYEDAMLIVIPSTSNNDLEGDYILQDSDIHNLDVSIECDLEVLGSVDLNTNKGKNDKKQVANVKTKKPVYKQKFRSDWKTDYHWLIERNSQIMCNVCNVAIRGNAFHIRRHSLSNQHRKNVTSIANTKTVKKTLSNPNKTFKDLVDEAEAKLALYICERNLPFQIIDSLSEVCQYIFSDSKIAEKLKIKRKKATTLAVTKIAPYVKKQLISKLQSRKFSLILDETTDVSTKKSIVLIARFWDKNDVQDRFLDLIEVKNCKAESLYQTIKDFLDANNIPYTNLAGFGADNCSVMMGDRGGLQSKLKRIAPDLIVQGCVCHSAHLCASKACAKLPNIIEQFARDIYSYFKNSSYRQEDLRECQIFKNEKPHKMLRLSQTRWLSLRAVIDNILQHWNSLKMFFEMAVIEDSLPTTRNILNGLNNDAIKIYFLFLSYVLELVTKINLEFQSESPHLPYLLERVTNLYKIILRSFIKNDVLQRKNVADILLQNSDNYKSLEEMYCGAKVDAFLKDSESKLEKKERHDFKLRALSFYIELCKQIKKRFDFNSPHLIFAANFTVQNALSGNIMSIAEFVNLYPSLNIDIEMANIEWQNLYHTFPLDMYQNYNLMQFWNMVDKTTNISDGKPMFEHLMALVKYILILPHSSAAAERTFSQLNLIKNKLRNKLNILTIASTLAIKDALKYKIIDYKTFSLKEIIKATNSDSVSQQEVEVLCDLLDECDNNCDQL